MSGHSQAAPRDPLSEPPLSRFLRVVRHELAKTIVPDLHSDHARSVAEMMQFVLDHVIVRAERLDALRASLDEAERTALGELENSLRQIGAGDSASDDFERALGKLMPRLSALPEDARKRALASVLATVAAERVLHDDIERHERGANETVKLPNEQVVPDAAQLQAYLNRRVGCETIRVKGIATPMGGYSKDTFIVGLEGEGRPADGIVIRRDMPNGPLESSAASELAVIRAMHEAGVPVAEPLWVEADASVLDYPFIVVKQVPGKQLLNMKLDVLGDEAKDCVRQLAHVLAGIHGVDPRRVGVDSNLLAEPVQSHILRLLDQFEDQWQRRRLGPSATIAAGLQWMRHNIPASLPGPRIVHGDATIRNMLFADGKVTAMLDWETWHFGDPGEDLAYCREEVERFMRWEDFLAEYHNAGGIPFSPESQRYWGMWMYLRGAITSVSQMDRLMIDPPADIRPAFGGPYFTRFCVRKVADYLQGV